MSETQVVVSGVQDARTEELNRVVTGIVTQMQKAWNTGNAAAFAAVFGPQADFIDLTGGHGVGQAAIAEAYKALFAGPFKGSQAAYKIDKLKPLGTGVAAVLLRQRVSFAREGGQAIVAFRPTLILRKGPQGWRVALFQNTRIAAGPAPAQQAQAAMDQAPDAVSDVATETTDTTATEAKTSSRKKK